MTILVYADKKIPEDSIGQRDDGAVTCLYGQSPDDWQDRAGGFVWVTGAVASAFMMDAGELLFTITEAQVVEEISKTQIRRDLYGFLLTIRRNIHAIDKRPSHNRRYPLSGICGLVKNELNSTTAGAKYAGWGGRAIIRKELAEGFKAWPKFSNDPVFPVPSDNRRDPGDMYTSVNSHWDINKPGSKRYAKLRRELLDFLIDYFKE